MILPRSTLSLLAQAASVMSSFLPLKTIPLPDKTNVPGSGDVKKLRVRVCAFAYDNGAFYRGSLASLALECFFAVTSLSSCSRIPQRRAVGR